MKTKSADQRFVFPDMSYQDFPNTTNKECAVIEKSISLINKKLVNGQLVEKSIEDLADETAARNSELDARHKRARQMALMSFELTIFPDTSLSAGQQTEILRVRQAWRDMTLQQGYPVDFVEPTIDPSVL